MASGDGFTASPGALDAASTAADTMWWWEEEAKKKSNGNGDGNGNGNVGGGVWRTRTEAVAPGAGIKISPPADTTGCGGGGGASSSQPPWTPWSTLLDNSEAPYFRWFVGAKTNACFNAVDRHLLDGRGNDVAVTCVPEEDSSATRSPPPAVDNNTGRNNGNNTGNGGDLNGGRYSVTRRELAGAVALAAVQLRDVHKLKARDRVLFHMPTDAVHFAYMLACQRLGVTYSATAVDSVEDVLTSRAEDLKPALVVCMDAPVVHGGITIDCAGKLKRAVPGVPMLLAKPWLSPGVQNDVAKYARISDDEAFVAVSKMAPPLPCEPDHPLFVSYTSGSTGKPKGVVHGHGGYVAGVLQSMVWRERMDPGPPPSRFFIPFFISFVV